ncbi:MAG TPA: DUF6365 family protein [Rhizomicrobium sp.]|jgi:hypothetical protein
MDVVFYFHPAGVPSYGELQQAIGFAADLRKTGYRPWFVAPERLSAQFLHARLELVPFENLDIAADIIDSIDPAIIIACEIFGMAQDSAEFLAQLPRLIGTMDGTTLGAEIASDPFKLEKFRQPITLPANLVYFRPCPVHDIGPDTRDGFHWAAYKDAARLPRDADLYRMLGLAPDRKTVLLAIAAWAEYFAGLNEEPFRSLSGYHNELVCRIADGLESWGEPVQLAVVAARPPQAWRDGKVSVQALSILPYQSFDHLLSSCDLIVSDNIIQASLSKALVMRIPHLVVENMVPSRLPYPSNIFPLGQLFPEQRTYSKIVDKVELTDAPGLYRALGLIAERGYADEHSRDARETYLEKLRDLPDPSTILRQFIGPPRRLAVEPHNPAQPNRDIVFYIEIWFSFGEREHALSLARQLRAAGYRPRFVVEYRIAEHIRSAGFEPVAFHSPGRGVDAVRRIDPALIIGCELFNMSELSVKGLMGLGKPIATVDGTSMGIEINTDPFRHPKLTRELRLPHDYWSFRPVPVSDFGAETDRVSYYNLFPDAARTEKNAAIYAELGLDPLRRTVLLPIALWSVIGSTLFNMVHYHKLLVDRVSDALRAVDTPIDLLIVGLEEDGSRRDGKVWRHTRARLPYPVYDHILCSCDAVLSDNIIQTSVAKAFAMDAPHLVIQNLGPSEVPFPCNIFPLKLLFPRERAYAQAVEVAEFGDPEDIARKLAGVLTRGWYDPDRRALRHAYIARLRTLPSPARAIEEILAGASELRISAAHAG